MEYDIALEIVGNMVAEQIERVSELTASYSHMGFSINDSALLSDENYKHCTQRISELNAELKLLYSAENIDELLVKIQTVYAPYLKAKIRLQRALVEPVQ